jgi:5-methylcytosine-specific restriction endonuclease McrA
MFSDDQRRAVFTRDRGVCSGCGKDTLAEDEYHRRGYRNTGDLWQADHVKPLFRSNGNMEFFKLANLQTLCTRCHKVKSNADRKGEGVGPIEHTPPLL